LTEPPPTLNDDSSFQVVSLHALEEHGLELDSWEIGLEWVAHIPTAMTAEGVALSNLKRGLRPPHTASEDNPFAEWVGAAMRAEVWGLLSPGRPDLACRYALRDAVISHQLNGIYGALFVAALLSLAFIQHDIVDLIRAALSFVPPRSRLAELVPRSFRWRSQCPTWRAALQRYQQDYAAYATTPYAHAHLFPCLASALIALLYGDGDLSRSLCIAAMCGGDTDFAPALVGAILGVCSGPTGIPERWRAPLGSEFDTMATGMERLRYDEFAQRICQLGMKLREEER
jgi:ADP-ribosylglycohydrolase